MEFKELVAYVRRWVFVIVGVSIAFAVLAYVAVGHLPNPEGLTLYSAAGEFETPSDPYRIISYGDSSFVRRVVLDPNTEIANVAGFRNVETTVSYYAILEAMVKDQENASQNGGDRGVTSSEEYADALRQLEARAGEIRNDGSSDSYYYRFTAGDKAYDIGTSVMPERLAQLRAARLAIQPIVEPVNNSRRVIVSVSKMKSANEARMWVDAILLAAKRESFQKLLGDFESIARRNEAEYNRVSSAVSDQRRTSLESQAETQISAKATLAAATRERIIATSSYTDSEEVPAPAPLEFAPQPEFSTDAETAEKLAYYGTLKRLIETRYPDVAAAVQAGLIAGSIEAQQLLPLRRDLEEELRRLKEAEVALRFRLERREKDLAAERVRYEEALAAGNFVGFQPNLSVVNSPEMSRTRAEVNNVLRERAQKQLDLRDTHRDMIRIERDLQNAIDRWKESIDQAFVAASAKIEADREKMQSDAATSRDVTSLLVSQVAGLEEQVELKTGIATLYHEAVGEEAAAKNELGKLASYISAVRRSKDLQSPVIQVGSFAPAATSSSALRAGPMQVAIIVFIVTLVASCVAIYVWMLSRNRISTEYDVRRHINLPVLAKFARRPASQATLLESGPRSQVHEAFSTLATLIRSYSKELSLRSLLVTSAVMEEGKTDVSSNLAIALSRKGLRVLVIDADLHRARVANFFGRSATSSKGLIQFVEAGGKGNLSEYVTSIENGPDLLLPGGQVEDPVRMLESETFKSAMKLAEREYDFVIYDSPPVTSVGDALILAGEVDATVMVCSCGDVTYADAAQAKRLLTNVHANLLGVVLNNCTDVRSGEYYNYYSYGDAPPRRRVRKVPSA